MQLHTGWAQKKNIKFLLKKNEELLWLSTTVLLWETLINYENLRNTWIRNLIMIIFIILDVLLNNEKYKLGFLQLINY